VRKYVTRYSKQTTLKPRAIIAEVPAANPSIPSVIFAPFETAVIIKITTNR
jgi:hypothetical protein